MKKTIMIMVDGFGVPPEGWGDSVYARYGSLEFATLFADSLPVSYTHLTLPTTPYV